MLKANREAIYYVEKRNREFIVEVLRTPDGKSFIAVHMTFQGKYLRGEEEREWNLLELEHFNDLKNAKIDYMTLPPDIRRALSKVFR